MLQLQKGARIITIQLQLLQGPQAATADSSPLEPSQQHLRKIPHCLSLLLLGTSNRQDVVALQTRWHTEMQESSKETTSTSSITSFRLPAADTNVMHYKPHASTYRTNSNSNAQQIE
jgi:hypothetical protein